MKDKDNQTEKNCRYEELYNILKKRSDSDKDTISRGVLVLYYADFTDDFFVYLAMAPSSVNSKK